MGYRLRRTPPRCRLPITSPMKPSAGQSRATSCRSGRSRWWRIEWRTAASPASACGWRKTRRRRQRFPPSSRKPRAICGRVSDEAAHSLRSLWAREQTEFAAHTEFHFGSEEEVCAPPAAEQQRRPERIAGHGIPEKRQRRDVAQNEAMEIVGVHAAERPDCKIGGRKEEQRRREDERGKHDHGPRASPPGEKRGERERGIDDAHDAPIVSA